MRREIKKYSYGMALLAAGVVLLAAALSRPKKEPSQPEDLASIKLALQKVSLEELNEGNKSDRYGGNQMTVTDPERGIAYSDSDVEIKGRGNSSWKLPKRGYQLKLREKRDMLGMGEAKKWLLIANYPDASLMRNRLICDLAGELMEYAPESRHVDLWVDGEYLGNYLLCEKVEVKDGRVELTDDRGLLVEIDNFYYFESEDRFQSPISGAYFTLTDAKNDAAAQEAFGEFETFIRQFESLLYAEEKDWEQIRAMIDVDSFVQYYFMEELAENSDSCRTSLYMYRDGPEDKLHMGPVWDFDKAVGYSMRAKFGGDTDVDYVKNIQDYMGTEKDMTWYTELFEIPEFREEVKRVYAEQVKDVFHTAGGLIEQYREEIKGSAERNFEKWEISEIPENCGHDPYTYETWEDAVDDLRSWVESRVAYLDRTYIN